MSESGPGWVKRLPKGTIRQFLWEAARNDSLFLETSVGSYLIVKEALRRLGASKIIFGSEFPLYHPQVELEKIRVLLKGEDLQRDTSKNILAMLPS